MLDPTLSVGDPVNWRRHKIRVLEGKRCFGGLDIGEVNDFTCLSLYFPKQEDVPIAVLLLWAWAPKETDCHKVLKERYGFDEWVRGEFLKLIPGPCTDFSVLREDILVLDRNYRIEELAYDEWHCTQLTQELLDAGVKMVTHRQGSLSMTGPIKEFERQIIGRTFVHGLNPLLTFMIDNLVVRDDGKGNFSCQKPGNPNSPRKIDGSITSIMATGRSAAHPELDPEARTPFFV